MLKRVTACENNEHHEKHVARNFTLRIVNLVLTSIFNQTYVSEISADTNIHPSLCCWIALVTQFSKYQNYHNLVKVKNVVGTQKQRLHQTKPHPTETDKGTLQD